MLIGNIRPKDPNENRPEARLGIHNSSSSKPTAAPRISPSRRNAANRLQKPAYMIPVPLACTGAPGAVAGTGFRGAPHLLQNAESSRLLVPHFGQNISDLREFGSA